MPTVYYLHEMGEQVPLNESGFEFAISLEYGAEPPHSIPTEPNRLFCPHPSNGLWTIYPPDDSQIHVMSTDNEIVATFNRVFKDEKVVLWKNIKFIN